MKSKYVPTRPYSHATRTEPPPVYLGREECACGIPINIGVILFAWVDFLSILLLYIFTVAIIPHSNAIHLIFLLLLSCPVLAFCGAINHQSSLLIPYMILTVLNVIITATSLICQFATGLFTIFVFNAYEKMVKEWSSNGSNRAGSIAKGEWLSDLPIGAIMVVCLLFTGLCLAYYCYVIEIVSSLRRRFVYEKRYGRSVELNSISVIYGETPMPTAPLVKNQF